MGYQFSLHRSGGWKGQFKRVERWHRRLKEAALSGDADLEDYVYVFFQNTLQLRDWIANECPQYKKEVYSLYNKRGVLGICRDIANATKHYKLTHKASVDQEISIAREYDSQAPNKYRLSILADNKYDLLSLADICLNQIRCFCDKIETGFYKNQKAKR